VLDQRRSGEGPCDEASIADRADSVLVGPPLRRKADEALHREEERHHGHPEVDSVDEPVVPSTQVRPLVGEEHLVLPAGEGPQHPVRDDDSPALARQRVRHRLVTIEHFDVARGPLRDQPPVVRSTPADP
jgi:hypothetical protein